MGRVKLPISRILNNTNRQVTYSKRRNGILKKAYEIAVLCDIDIALIMISPSGRISFFSGTKRIEDVMLQYFHLADEERELDQDSESIVCDRECVISTLMRLRTEETATQSPRALSKQAEEYKQEITNLQHQLEIAKEQLRVFEPDPEKFKSLGEVESCEQRLSETLSHVEERKRYLLSDHSSSYQETVEQINTVVQYIINAQAEGAASSLENPEFSSWHENGNKNSINGSSNVCAGSDASPIFHRNQSSAAVVDSVSRTSTMNDDKQRMEGCQISSIRDECLQQWHQSCQLFPALMPQEPSFSFTDMQSARAATVTPAQHAKGTSPSQLP